MTYGADSNDQKLTVAVKKQLAHQLLFFLFLLKAVCFRITAETDQKEWPVSAFTDVKGEAFGSSATDPFPYTHFVISGQSNGYLGLLAQGFDRVRC